MRALLVWYFRKGVAPVSMLIFKSVHMDVHIVNRLIPGETRQILRFEAEIPLLKPIQKEINIDKPACPANKQASKNLKHAH